MIEPNGINQFVSTVGFPIAAFCMMWHLTQKTMKEQTSAFHRLTDEIRKKK